MHRLSCWQVLWMFCLVCLYCCIYQAKSGHTYDIPIIGNATADGESYDVSVIDNGTKLLYVFQEGDSFFMQANASGLITGINLDAASMNLTQVQFNFASGTTPTTAFPFSVRRIASSYNQNTSMIWGISASTDSRGFSADFFGALNISSINPPYNNPSIPTSTYPLYFYCNGPQGVFNFHNVITIVSSSQSWNHNVWSHNCVLNFYDVVTATSDARADQTTLYTESLGALNFYSDVSLHSVADWSGDDLDVIYNNNVDSKMYFAASLTIVGYSYSSTVMGIRSQGFLTVNGPLSVYANGVRTAFGIANTHRHGVMWLHSSVTATVIGAHGTFGDVIGFNNAYGGKIYFYGTTIYANVLGTSYSNAWGIQNSGIFSIPSNCAISLIVSGTGSAAYSTGIWTSANMALYEFSANVSSWNNVSYSLIIANSATVTLNCQNASYCEDSYKLALTGGIWMQGVNSSLVANFNTSDSFHAGSFLTLPANNSFVQVQYHAGATWFVENKATAVGNDSIQVLNIEFNSADFTFDSGATIDLGSMPAPASNLTTFPVKLANLSFTNAFSWNMTHSKLHLRSDLLALSTDGSSPLCDSLSLPYGSIVTNISVFIIYDLLLSDQNFTASKVSPSGSYSSTLSSPLPILSAEQITSYMAGTTTYPSNVTQSGYVTFTPTLQLSASSNILYLTGFTLSSGNAPTQPTSGGVIAGAVIGSVLGAGLIAGAIGAFAWLRLKKSK